MSEPRSRAVLFVHGAGGGGWEWDVWARVFVASGYSVFAPDLLPAQGGIARTRLADYSEQVQAKLKALRTSGAGPLVLAGASLGGLLALMNASECDALVLVNPMPPAPWHARLPAHDPSPAVIPWAATASLEGTRRSMPDADDAACLFAFRRWRDESGAVLDEARAGVAVPTPTCPALVLASGNDMDVPLDASAAVAAEIGADLQRFPRASHVGPLLGRNAAAIAQLTVAWLNTALSMD